MNLCTPTLSITLLHVPAINKVEAVWSYCPTGHPLKYKLTHRTSCPPMQIPFLVDSPIHTNKMHIIGEIYRPPQYQWPEFFENLFQITEGVALSGATAYIMDDFNVNMLKCPIYCRTARTADLVNASPFNCKFPNPNAALITASVPLTISLRMILHLLITLLLLYL